jgi:hypothetical protein
MEKETLIVQAVCLPPFRKERERIDWIRAKARLTR